MCRCFQTVMFLNVKLFFFICGGTSIWFLGETCSIKIVCKLLQLQDFSKYIEHSVLSDGGGVFCRICITKLNPTLTDSLFLKMNAIRWLARERVKMMICWQKKQHSAFEMPYAFCESKVNDHIFFFLFSPGRKCRRLGIKRKYRFWLRERFTFSFEHTSAHASAAHLKWRPRKWKLFFLRLPFRCHKFCVVRKNLLFCLSSNHAVRAAWPKSFFAVYLAPSKLSYEN